jgi:general secretion pathway protein K
MVAINRAALDTQTNGVRPISYVQLDDLLVVPGCTPQMINVIRPHVVILPTSTTVNINTATPEVLAARLPGLSLADASALASSRRQTAFRSVADLAARLPGSSTGFDSTRLSVTSGYFMVTGIVTIRAATLEVQALVERLPTATRLLWVREV